MTITINYHHHHHHHQCRLVCDHYAIQQQSRHNTKTQSVLSINYLV